MGRTYTFMSCLAATAAMVIAPVFAQAESITIPKDTDVNLVFDQGLSSKTAKAGDTVKLHVADNVIIGGKTVIKAGTPVMGTITKVDKRKHFGVNAKMAISLNPVSSTRGTAIQLDPKSKGKLVDSKRTGTAAAASGGGALLLGPIGLVGGYFVVGKPVTVHAGDHLVSTVSHDTTINWK